MGRYIVCDIKANQVTTYMSSIQSGGSGTTFWNTTPTFGTPHHRAAGILGQLFGTTPQLLEHHPIGATTRTPIGQGRSSGATFGTPPHRGAWPPSPGSPRPTRPKGSNVHIRTSRNAYWFFLIE